MITSPIECKHCRFVNPPRSHFCQECGKPLSDSHAEAKHEEIKHDRTEPKRPVITVPPPSSKEEKQSRSEQSGTVLLGSFKSSKAALGLVLLSEEREAVETFEIKDGDILGRQQAAITIPDLLISRSHCRFTEDAGEYSVEDLESKNGTFLRIRKEAQLEEGSELRIGHLIFRLEKGSQAAPANSETTAVFSSGQGRSSFRLVLLSEEKKVAQEFPIQGTVRLGRQEGEIIISDPYISRLHCEFHENSSGVLLKDAGSKNGVFLRIKKKETLRPGDELRIGTRLFLISESKK